MIKKHIYILATGGTIAGRAASEEATTGYQAGAIGVADLLAAVPEIRRYACLLYTSRQAALRFFGRL